MPYRRMLPFILVNILVSAAVVLVILFWWDSRQANLEPAVNQATVARSTAAAEDVATEAAAELAAATALPDEEAAGPIIYTIQAGDTLGTIALQFDVTLEDIITVNQLDNPNVIDVGQQLIIPVGGIPTPTPQPTPTATTAVIPSPIPTAEFATGEADIQITAVIGVGDLTQEAVTVANQGNRSVALLGWRLLDDEGREYRFGQFTLFGDGAVIVHTEAGRDTISDLYWGLEESIWTSGDTVILQDAEGNVRARFVIP